MVRSKSHRTLARAVSNWDPCTKPVNYVLLGGKKSPGITDLEGIPEEFKLDVRWGMGLSGASTPCVGRPPIEFSMKHRLYTPDDWLDWHRWLAYIQPQIIARGIPGAVARTEAFDIVHPFTADARILTVVIQKIVHPKLTRDDGEWTAEVVLREWRRPKPGYAEADKPKGPEPLDEREQKIRDKMNELDALSTPSIGPERG